MKINKKVLIPVFATALGLSVIGGVGGAVAWYQYNSKVTASYIGVSTADTGVLRISQDEGSTWTRAVDKGNNNTLKPVTFEKDASDKFDMSKGWTTPEAGAGNGLGLGSYYVGKDYVPASGSAAEEKGYAGWIQAGSSDFAQFDLYFDAFQVNPEEDSEGYTHVARPVFLSNYILRSLDSSDQVITTKFAEEAIRIQFDIYNEENTAVAQQIITGKNAGTTALNGKLDLDGSGAVDEYHATPFNNVTTGEGGLNGQEIEYGIHGANQVVTELGSYNSKDNPLFTTFADADNPIHVKISIWLEGWALLNGATRAEWNPFEAAGCKVQVGLEFTTGEFRGTDLNTL